jgi:hypothetical protein
MMRQRMWIFGVFAALGVACGGGEGGGEGGGFGVHGDSSDACTFGQSKIGACKLAP